MKLEVLQENVRTCTKCPDLVTSRKQPVFGEGNPNTKLLIIGEAPGATEDDKNRPFCGDSGNLLDQIIKACGWRREDLFISNTIRCRPANNRKPVTTEVANCKEHLDALIDFIKPQYILALGSVATIALVGIPVTQARVADLSYKGITVFATYHPSYILHQESDEAIKRAKACVWGDLAMLRSLLA